MENMKDVMDREVRKMRYRYILDGVGECTVVLSEADAIRMVRDKYPDQDLGDEEMLKKFIEETGSEYVEPMESDASHLLAAARDLFGGLPPVGFGVENLGVVATLRMYDDAIQRVLLTIRDYEDIHGRLEVENG